MDQWSPRVAARVATPCVIRNLSISEGSCFTKPLQPPQSRLARAMPACRPYARGMHSTRASRRHVAQGDAFTLCLYMEEEVRRSTVSPLNCVASFQGEVSNARCITVGGYGVDFLEILTLLPRRACGGSSSPPGMAHLCGSSPGTPHLDVSFCTSRVPFSSWNGSPLADSALSPGIPHLPPCANVLSTARKFIARPL